MDLSTQRLMMGAAGSAAPTYVENVFSTWLYTGNGSTQTITNGIDLSGKGGLVWIKERDNIRNHFLYDTARGATNCIATNSTAEQLAGIAGRDLYQYNSDGFNLGTNYWGGVNTNGVRFASWTFRKAAKFFDVVTYTGDGTAGRTVSHNLGSTPGCIILKEYSAGTGDAWYVWHRGFNSGDGHGFLNTTAAFGNVTTPNIFGNGSSYVAPTSTNFTVGGSAGVNESGATYVAYLFAHDAGGFGDSGNDSVVSCGSYTYTSGSLDVNLGWEPQWILVKRSDSTGNWVLWDTMRGWFVDGATGAVLYPNLSNSEFAVGSDYEITPTGFRVFSGTGTYIYIAIRRGPMKTPTDATKVFLAATATQSSGTSRSINFVSDMYINSCRPSGATGHVQTRLINFGANASTGSSGLLTPYTQGEFPYSPSFYDIWNSTYTDGAFLSGLSNVWYHFGRAPGFFDVVCYTGTGVARTVSHNLRVAPELWIIKSRSASSTSWQVGSSLFGTSDSFRLILNGNSANLNVANAWQSPTSTTIGIGSTYASNVNFNASGSTYVAYLFASCPGVSKVGSYTGTGTTQQINCGFTSGARFVLIKRTDSTGDWYFWDTARGIVAGNDPYLRFNVDAAEVTGTDYIDPLNSGFEISSTAPAEINANGGSFIFLAIA